MNCNVLTAYKNYDKITSLQGKVGAHMLDESLRFEWDSAKNEKNKGKHGISFEEAETVFYDLCAILKEDDAHSLYEERFQILGMSQESNLLIVCHCYREYGNIVRIISARKATATEKSEYLYRRGESYEYK